MDSHEWIVLIGAIVTGVTSIVGAIFAGLIALRQTPAQNRELSEIKTQVVSSRDPGTVEHQSKAVEAESSPIGTNPGGS